MDSNMDTEHTYGLMARNMTVIGMKEKLKEKGNIGRTTEECTREIGKLI